MSKSVEIMHMKNVGNALRKENKAENLCMFGPNKQNEFRPNLAKKNPTKQSNKPERNSIKTTKRKATNKLFCRHLACQKGRTGITGQKCLALQN